MTQFKSAIKTITFLSLFAVLLSSCSKEEIHSNFIVYDDGQELSFSDGDNNAYVATVEMKASHHAILRFKDNKLPDLEIKSSGSHVNHLLDLDSEVVQRVINFRETIAPPGPDALLGYGLFMSDVTLNDTEYGDVATAYILSTDIGLHVHTVRGRGVIGFKLYDDNKVIEIDVN